MIKLKEIRYNCDKFIKKEKDSQKNQIQDNNKEQ